MGVYCISEKAFYEVYSTVNVKQIAHNTDTGYIVTPAVMYDSNHAYLIIDPRAKQTGKVLYTQESNFFTPPSSDVT